MNNLPPRHQTLLFSATMPKEIEDLAKAYLTNPVTVKVSKQQEKERAVRGARLYHQGEQQGQLLCSVCVYSSWLRPHPDNEQRFGI